MNEINKQTTEVKIQRLLFFLKETSIFTAVATKDWWSLYTVTFTLIEKWKKKNIFSYISIQIQENFFLFMNWNDFRSLSGSGRFGLKLWDWFGVTNCQCCNKCVWLYNLT